MEINVSLSSTEKKVEKAQNAVTKQEQKIFELKQKLEAEKVKLSVLKAAAKDTAKAAKAKGTTVPAGGAVRAVKGADMALRIIKYRHKVYGEQAAEDGYPKDRLVYSIPTTDKFVSLEEVLRFVEEFKGTEAAEILSIPKSWTKGNKVAEGSWAEPVVAFDVKKFKWIDTEV